MILDKASRTQELLAELTATRGNARFLLRILTRETVRKNPIVFDDYLIHARKGSQRVRML
jgi:hypothetical protein